MATSCSSICQLEVLFACAATDLAIQSNILNSSWFKASKRLCAYISCAQLREVDTSKILAEVLSQNSEHDGQAKDIYVPRVEDKNRNMRMFKITTMDDLVKNSMNILEPSPLDASGNAREDVLSASSPIDLFLLPGQAFDRTGRRLGRGGGYYDTFLMRYQELAKENGWSQPLLDCVGVGVRVGPKWAVLKQKDQSEIMMRERYRPSGATRGELQLSIQATLAYPVLVALSYSVQILEEGVIPVNSTDVPIDALVTSSGVIPISPAALERLRS
ncbi:5-formyltetrahydrofolate cyclo-ligase, mitochondrial isoform X3 [Brachypodium distachyon]|uniref:5-formyltetrahydrofolate cyclo-ligase, mitochondrial isoform X3 n=1 Tax=Brachypodium distachyon TaxID=15368 RepID=UPI000D0E05FD|nr:5-formyltetrahydrofolate cyclo-ligase, mitochondrial isoform X3 [Brachypodium distachyon]|eukprot:XP_024313556.1 5-formyltetrahydrofolate cyclo-ligase, mitochondrial isoform X3 [Brachypodium distachyon]